MILLKTEQTSDRQRMVAILGLGLIGSAIRREIEPHATLDSVFVPMRWNQTTDVQRAIARIGEHLGGKQAADFRSELAIIWAAGLAGFQARHAVTRPELENFKMVTRGIRDLVGRHPGWRIEFHLLSSAGGLFEGQRNVSSSSTPAPLRPYGELKLAQEEFLLALDEKIRVQIYRPTSVYGYAGMDKRLGLIPTLLVNGMRNTVSSIFGELSTLRDYVHASDVAAFIHSRIFAPGNQTGNYLLASGKPTSILEVLQTIERLIGKRLYINFQSRHAGNNALDITVNRNALPTAWNPVNLLTGARRVREQLLSPRLITRAD